jgi:nucleoside-diphosphate-sugar epimerase
MKNIAVLGTTGKLGSFLITLPNTVSLKWRFEDSQEKLNKWFEDHPDINTIWHVARTCRKKGIRRDHLTFRSELNGIIKLMTSKAKHCRFVYASSKVVYGIAGNRCCVEKCNHNYQPLNVEQVAEYFKDDKKGIYNCPTWQDYKSITTTNLDDQTKIYALTKLVQEKIIESNFTNYKILRIWDIV